MGHRNVPGTFWPGHCQHDQNLSHYDVMQQHMHFGYAGASDPNQVAYPVENRFMSQEHIHPNWDGGHSTVSGGYSYTHQSNGFQHHQLNGAPINHPFPALPAVPAFPSSHVNPSSSSNNGRPGFYRNEPSYDDLRLGGRGSSKRKRFAFPFGGARENTNGIAGAGSSSSGHVHPNFQQEKSSLDYTHHWERHAMWTSSSTRESITAIDEGDTRNVRRRYGYNVGSVVPGVSVPFEHPAIHRSGYFGSLDSTHKTFGGVNSSWRHSHVPSAAPGMMPVADFRNSYQGSNLAFCGSRAPKFSSEARGYGYPFHGTRGPFDHENSSENLTRPIQVAHSFSQQYPEINRNTHNDTGAGPSHGCPQMVIENYSSIRHARPFHCEVFVPTGRNGGPRILQERRRFLPGDICGPDISRSEGFIVGDPSATEIFGDMFDQHSDMRLDVDNLTYEELVALGERIGSVCTGLSDDGVSECLVEVLYQSSSEQEKDEESCAICLEEYQKMDSVGKLGGCGHAYHSSCVKKWLSIKNSCPICKAPGLAAENTDSEEK